MDIGAYEFQPCVSDADCPDRDPCTRHWCEGGACSYSPNLYADVDFSDAVNVFDVLRILDGISGTFEYCTFPDVDIEPCPGNQVINALDALAAMDAIAGYDPCCSGQPLGGPGGASGGSSSAGTAELTLEVREVTGPGFVTYEVDIYASDFVDLRAYEVALDVNGGGGLEVQRVFDDTMRPDYVFAGLESYSGLETAGGRIVTVSMDGGVASVGAVYLGTFVLRATEDAHGTFEVLPRTEDGTILLDSLGQRVTVLNEPEAKVSLP